MTRLAPGTDNRFSMQSAQQPTGPGQHTGSVWKLHEWPLITAVWPSRPVTDEELADTLAHMRELMEQRVVLVACVQSSAYGHDPQFSAKQRRRFVDFFEEHSGLCASYCAGIGIVTYSPLMRGVVTAVSWLTRPSFDFATFGTPTAAREWCLAKYVARTGRDLRVAPADVSEVG